MLRVTEAVRTAGELLRRRHSPQARGVSLDEIVTEIHANDDAALDVLRAPLMAARPGARWAEDELEGGALPPGEWWIVDPAEGNMNHVHGMDDWAVTATLVRDNHPVLTVVHLPPTGDWYTAVAGHGAHLNDAPLRVSANMTSIGILGTGRVGSGLARALATADHQITLGHRQPRQEAEVIEDLGDITTARATEALVLLVPHVLRRHGLRPFAVSLAR
ncbi:inositol monophosphatase family protein [Streptomyces antimycoticus]|uniref:inositol monophosphatase family protein n=1 Tax=Streptomyces antimycoticus TaxID=68175 RepID=UPI0034287593